MITNSSLSTVVSIFLMPFPSTPALPLGIVTFKGAISSSSKVIKIIVSPVVGSIYDSVEAIE